LKFKGSKNSAGLGLEPLEGPCIEPPPFHTSFAENPRNKDPANRNGRGISKSPGMGISLKC
jgi:hypothetical protein